MAAKVSQKWLDREFENFKNSNVDMIGGTSYKVVTTFLPSVKALCLSLARAGIPYKVINMGGGVKVITNDVKACPKCGGCGKC